MKNYFSFIGIATICTMNSTVLCQEFTTNKPHFTQEMTMQDYKIIQKPTIMVIGIECRTSNAPEAAPHDIPKHWEQFYKNDTINQIPNKTSSEVIALYCDYEGDYTQPYSLVIGCPVDSLDDIPKGMVAKTIPNGSYAIFRAIGDHPKSLIETWGNIWQQPTLERTYTGDYEVYGDKFSNSPPEVEVYIAIEQEKVRHLEGVQLKESKIGQFDDGIGAFANRDFKKGEVVIKWDLKSLSSQEYNNLSENEKNNFCHQRGGVYWLYPDPERHVNRFHSPNVIPDFEKQANIAIRDIKKGEELSIADNTIEDF